MSEDRPSIIRLKKGRESSLLRRHPWIFSGAIDKMEGNPTSGDLVTVVDSADNFLGRGAYSSSSQIRVRILSFADEEISRACFSKKISQAIAKRQHLLANPQRTAYRLIYGESDHLPGLVVDKYADTLVCQFLFAGIEPWKSTLVELLVELTGCQNVYERSDVSSRTKEGLKKLTAVLHGTEPAATTTINENGMLFDVDIVSGQKTGFYLDQADNREFLRDQCQNKSVLNCFSYTGGFSIAALQGGASTVVSVDSSAPALQVLENNIANNKLDASRHTAVNGNVFHVLRDFQTSGEQFDIVILDPPKFADSKNQVMKAARAYKDLMLQACQLVKPGGMLVSFSCSGSIDMNLFQKICSDALLDAKRQGEVMRYLHQAADHPIALEFPESQYLKGLVCRIN